MATIYGIGRLGREPKMQFNPQGSAMTSLSVAVNSGFGDKKETTWFDMVAFGTQAEALNQYLSKGSRFSFVAEFQGVKTFEKNDGSTGITAKARIMSFEFLDKSGEGNQEPEEF